LWEGKADFCNLSEGLILTHNQEDTLTIENTKIIVLQVWKWLMKSVMPKTEVV